MKLKLKTITFRGTPSCNQALALLVALGTITAGSSLFARDPEAKYETPDSQGQRYLRADQQEDLDAKTNPEKFISHVAQSGVKEIRLANLAKQRSQNQEVKEFAEKLIQDHTKANQELKLIAQHQNIPWGIAEEKTPAAASVTAQSARNVDASASVTSSERDKTRSSYGTPAEENGTARGAGVLDNSAPVAPVTITTDRETPAAANETARGAYQVRNDYDQNEAYERLVGLTGVSFDEAYLTHEVQSHTKAVAKFEKASRDLPDGELKQFVQSTLPTLREHLALAQKMAPADTTRLNIRERTDRDSNSDQDQANK